MKIPLFKIYWDDEDISSVDTILKSGAFWSSGTQIKTFENNIAKYLGSKYCITFNSGGSALHALMLAHGLKPNDEVIVPSFTFIATCMAPKYVGSKPVFADIEEETFGLDPNSVLEKITPDTKAIIPVHYAGISCKIDELREIAEAKDLLLIEDAAEAFGAKYNNKFVGTYGDSSIFSFCQNKIFATGEGGCVVTDDEEVYNKLNLICSYGRISKENYFSSNCSVDYVDIGYNWRLPTILACLGISQLDKVEKLIKMRRKNAEYLNKNLNEIKGVKTINVENNNYAVYQLYSILLENTELRGELIQFLNKKEISSKIYFDPVHKYSVFKSANVNLPVTEDISSKILTLPMYPHMTIEEMDYVIDCIEEFFRSR
ncbi:DegT/DnrJ/EryC1/StrS aminotransferase [Methanococcus maripaludis C5]|uniref:DegT/DnrJ/EryC1/StrS aminotransferase n=1 Tax=Methanococcus maripaludis (strain C5 / ATCC BAA-1333) TaxID=402880 RepID=A4FX87_METM5|nr:DegT/DnrJ/EryC1/StrS family aminotransferase [Methanococcus maripaludis]ABO34816.1 DegT/DnrJ/EryC1/StrS aminotransferase [Methanococcus maripaludis C5]